MIYGGTSAGVIAAVQAKQLGKSVIIVGPDQHLGGLSSGGLGMTGDWKVSRSAPLFFEQGYRHERNKRDGNSQARFEAKLPKAGRYEVRFSYLPHSNRALNVVLDILHANGSKKVVIDQRKPPPIDSTFISLGIFEFAENQPASVSVLNLDTDGYVVIDAVQWLAQ